MSRLDTPDAATHPPTHPLSLPCCSHTVIRAREQGTLQPLISWQQWAQGQQGGGAVVIIWTTSM